jgi:hypothetical protein
MKVQPPQHTAPASARTLAGATVTHRRQRECTMFSYFRTAGELMSQQEPDPLPQWTNEPCPFCGQRIQWDGDQLFCAPCQRTWTDWSDVRFDRHEVKYAARKAAQVAAEEALMWEYYEAKTTNATRTKTATATR